MNMPDLDTIEALTFDCYGTLIDWEAGILRAIRPLLTVRGIRPDDAELVALYASLEAAAEKQEYRSYRECLHEVTSGIAAKYGVTLEDRELARLAESVARWEPFPDTVSSLRRLSERYRLVVCSNIDDDLFEATAEKLDVPFEYVVTASYCRSYKPDPRHFRVALALLDLPPRRVLHVAQSRYHDIAPAGAMGLPTCWVNRPSVLANRGVTPAGAAGEPDMKTTDLATLASMLGV